jgi:hypothetical protein
MKVQYVVQQVREVEVHNNYLFKKDTIGSFKDFDLAESFVKDLRASCFIHIY